MTEVNGNGKISKAIRELQEELQKAGFNVTLGNNITGRKSSRTVVLDGNAKYFSGDNTFGSNQTIIPRWG